MASGSDQVGLTQMARYFDSTTCIITTNIYNLQRNTRSLSTSIPSTMGFFASRWIEKHGAANEKAALSPLPTFTTTTSGLAGPNTSSSEGAGTVKAKWVGLIAIVIISQRQHQERVLDVEAHPLQRPSKAP